MMLVFSFFFEQRWHTTRYMLNSVSADITDVRKSPTIFADICDALPLSITERPLFWKALRRLKTQNYTKFDRTRSFLFSSSDKQYLGGDVRIHASPQQDQYNVYSVLLGSNVQRCKSILQTIIKNNQSALWANSWIEHYCTLCRSCKYTQMLLKHFCCFFLTDTIHSSKVTYNTLFN